MRKNAAKVELEERLRAMGPDYVILSRDEALEHIEKIEMLKVMNMTGAIIANKKGNLPDDRVSMIMEMAPMMAIDMYNKQTGGQIEDSDVVIAFNTYNFGESEEVAAIKAKA